MSSTAYRRLESIWARDGVVVLDGGVGSELERIGFPRNRNVGDLWGTVALFEAPELALEVHRRYVRAGADVITTHTWRIDGIPAAERAGLVDPTAGGWRAITLRAGSDGWITSMLGTSASSEIGVKSATGS